MVAAERCDNDSKAIDALPTPAYRVRKSALFFRIGVGLFLTLSGLLAIASCASNGSSPLKWQAATTVLEPEVVFDLVLNNVSDKTPVAEIESMLEQVEMSPLGRNQEQDLWLVRFNFDVLCGRLGCLHTIVSRDSDPMMTDQIWTHYLQPDSPTGSAFALVSPPNGEVELSKFLCLEITQVSHGSLVHRTHCYQNGSYRVVVEEQLAL
ncbi:MAG: hypothetical protein AAGD25_15255 [Cyanobacteria bacterium P01_F01_bin.150]